MASIVQGLRSGLTRLPAFTPAMQRTLEAVFGPSFRVHAFRGVLHSVAVVERAGALHVIRTGAPGAPRSAEDLRNLMVCRAVCDGILTSAANLRAEPRITPALRSVASAGLSADLLAELATTVRAQRAATALREMLRPDGLPTSDALCDRDPGRCAYPAVVLTRGEPGTGSLLAAHRFGDPAMHEHFEPAAMCPAPALLTLLRELRDGLQAAGRAGIVDWELHELAPGSAPPIARALEWMLRPMRLGGAGCTAALVEAGPRLAGAMYTDPHALPDALLLAEAPEQDCDPAALAGPLCARATIESGMALEHESRDASGRWSFQFWLKR